MNTIGQQNTATRQFNDYGAKQAHDDVRSTVGATIGADQCEQSYIANATQHLENQLEQCLSNMDVLMHRLRVVSRDPNLAREEKLASVTRGGNSEFAQRLHGLMERAVELDRRIAIQLDMLEI